MTECPECGQQVPERKFCVRCGAQLKAAKQGERGFAAAPHEHRMLPSIVSSLFPHLPRADMRHYRVAMGVGTALVIGLAIAGLFPLALAGGAVLIPILAALYLRDVNIYESEPLLVIGFTLVWGAIAGAGLGLLAHALEPNGIDQLASGNHPNFFVTVILLPLLEFGLAMAGPVLVLLPNKKFNDVLDGVTFGAATAAALSATLVIVNGYKIFEHGLRPGGHVLPWIWRLLTVRISLPILAMAATGAACGALWLQVRGRPEDRDALGLLGRPLIAFPLRAAMLMVAAAGERWLPVGAWFVLLVVLDALALLWLRQMLHLGLREESAEREIGPDVQCPNCGSQTPHHTFCAECGVSLRALPKRGVAAPAPEAPEAAPAEAPTAPPAEAPPGEAPEAPPAPAPPPVAAPLPHRRPLVTASRLVAFMVFLGFLGVAAAVIGTIAPSKATAPCQPGKPCGQPPTAAPLQSQTVWRSSALGFQLEYAPARWTVANQTATAVELRSTVANVDLIVQGMTGLTAQQAAGGRVSDLRGRILGLAADQAAPDAILGPEIGYHYGVGGAFVGAVDSPQGVQDQVLVTVQAAASGNIGIVTTTLTTETSPSVRRQAYGLVDGITNTVTWPGGNP